MKTNKKNLDVIVKHKGYYQPSITQFFNRSRIPGAEKQECVTSTDEKQHSTALRGAGAPVTNLSNTPSASNSAPLCLSHPSCETSDYALPVVLKGNSHPGLSAMRNGSRKKLSLKIRKRKRTCSSTKFPEICTEKPLVCSDDDEPNIIALYGDQKASPIDTAAVGVVDNSVTRRRHAPGNIPACPSFSPRKVILKNFSPASQERKRCRLEGSPESSAENTSYKNDVTVSRRELFPRECSSHDQSCNISAELEAMSDLLSYSVLYSDLDESLTSNETQLTRYLVMEKVSQMSSTMDRPKPEVLLRLFDEKRKIESICYLRDDWLSTDVEAGDVVQLNADYDAATSCFTLDNSSQFTSIVVNPDVLISCTTVANSTTCTRRAVLSEKFKMPQSNEVMLMGQFLHELFQRVLLRLNKSNCALEGTDLKSVVREEIENVLSTVGALDKMFCVGISESTAHEALSSQSAAIVWWCKNYLRFSSTDETTLHKTPAIDAGTNSCCVVEVLDIEENIWSPRYGLKGKVDVSVSSEVVGQSVAGEKAGSRVPLELKTGKMYRKQGTIEHRAQVALYTLMLADRYSSQPPGGLLYYLKGQHMQALPSLPHELRGLISARNSLSHYLSPSGDYLAMPGLLKDKFTCKYCPQAKVCMVYHRAMEDGNPMSSGVEELYTDYVSHLSMSQLKFFSKWYSLTALEESQNRLKDQIPIWLSDPDEREKEGNCIAYLLAQSVSLPSPFQHQIQTFIKAPGSGTGGVLSSSEAVVISRQDGSAWAVSTGTVTKSLANGGAEVLVDKIVPSDGSILYRIDSVNSFGRGSMTGALTEFCTSDSERVGQLRSLIIDHQPPKFTALSSVEHSLSNTAKNILTTLNTDQRNAVLKVLSSEDYTLILGMPGTGKTTAIAALVKVLVALGKTVLITSYTHSAVDNILLKLKDKEVSFLRLGSVHRVHPSLHEFLPAHVCRGFSSTKQLESVYINTPVIATTCLGIHHGIFSRRSFDLCIIDEASQITLPITIGPLCHASKFVLVGDPYQLRPLVICQQAREGGLDVSLFRYLFEKHPSAIVCLKQQYRMNREIMSLSNKLVYNNTLSCGSEAIAGERLSLPHLTIHSVGSFVQDCPLCIQAFHCTWIRQAIDPERPVVFVNTGNNHSSLEAIHGGYTCNMFEAEIVAQLIKALLVLGLEREAIGVITPICYQKNIIKQILTSTGFKPEDGEIEVNTIDKYQGRDKDCILVSFVRNNSNGNTGPLLKDWRRLNVALTRAKKKLLLVGSRATMCRTPLLKNLVEHLSEMKAILNLFPS